MSLTKIKGQNFRAFVGGSAVPEESNVQVSINGNMEDSKSKDSEGSFNQETMVSRSWSVNVDSYQATAAELIGMINQFLSDDTVQVGWDQTATTAGTQNRTPSNAPFARSGQARLIDLSIQANNRSNIQVTRQYQGYGAIS